MWCHFVLEVLHGLFVPPQGCFEVRHVDCHDFSTVLLLAYIYCTLVRATTLVIKGFHVASGFRPQRHEQTVHVVIGLGGLSLLLLPYVLQNELDHDRIEDTQVSAVPYLC